VLVVDDNHDTCELLARILRRAGHDAACETTPHGALRYLTTTTPDLIIADVMMPEMNGLDMLKAIRSNPASAGVTVLVFSALSDDRTREEARRLGANGYVVKGTGWGALQAEIEKHIGPTPVNRPPPAPSA
jgi:DNA-binding response OmpR family regulator